MNSKDSRYWIRDYTDTELDNALDAARSRLQATTALWQANKTDVARSAAYVFAKQWFLALVDETASRWRLFDAHAKKHAKM